MHLGERIDQALSVLLDAQRELTASSMRWTELSLKYNVLKLDVQYGATITVTIVVQRGDCALRNFTEVHTGVAEAPTEIAARDEAARIVLQEMTDPIDIEEIRHLVQRIQHGKHDHAVLSFVTNRDWTTCGLRVDSSEVPTLAGAGAGPRGAFASLLGEFKRRESGSGCVIG